MVALNRVLVDDVQLLRQLEGDRLDALQVAIWEQAMTGDLRAVNVLLRIIAIRCKLFGLDRKPDEKKSQWQGFSSFEEGPNMAAVRKTMLWLEVSEPARIEWEATLDDGDEQGNDISRDENLLE